MPSLSFLRLFALWGLLSACTFADYHPPLSQAVAPGYKVRVLPSHPAAHAFDAQDVQFEDLIVPEVEPQPQPAVVVGTPDPEVAVATPEPEVTKIPGVVFVPPPVPVVTEEELMEPVPEIDPTPQPDNRYALAEQALDRGAYADAFRHFLSLIDDHPTNPDFFFRAGFSAFMAGEKNQGESWFPQATALLRRCLELHPQHIEGQFVLGCVYDWSEEWFAAEKAYKRTIEMDPGHRKAIQNLVALYQRQGLDSKARELLILLRRL